MKVRVHGAQLRLSPTKEN